MDYNLISKIDWKKDTTSPKLLSMTIAKYKTFLEHCRGLGSLRYHFKVNDYIEDLLHNGRISGSDRNFFNEERDRNLRDYNMYLFNNANHNRRVDDFTLDVIDENRRPNGH